MTFAAPLWLLGLLAWAAAVAYLLWGRRRPVDVPFLALWPSRHEGAVRVRRRATPPPIALALAILAMLLGILAAGRPAVRAPGGREPLTVIVDRGWAMSAAGALPGNHPNYNDLAKVLGAGQPVEVWTVPGGGREPFRTTAAEMSSGALRDLARPTAMETRGALHARIHERLGNTGGGVVVCSHLTADASAADTGGGRVVWVSPEVRPGNAWIELLAVREAPAVQAMVRVRAGTTGLTTGKLRLTSGTATAEQDVALQPGDAVDAFVDLPALDAVIKAELLVENDDQPADNVAWLFRETSWPRVEPRTPLPDHVQRMLDVYDRQRPPGDGSRRVIVARSVDDVPAGEAAVVLAPTGGPTGGVGRGRNEPLEVAEHAVTRNLNWAELGYPPLAATGPPAGWTPVVRGGGKVWVAVREQPIRAVWVGFDAGDWARTSDFVVFWANVLNWAGAGGERFASHPAGSLDGDWTAVELAPSVAPPESLLWPGVYRRSDGTLRALRPPDVPDAAPVATDWRQRLAKLVNGGGARVELAHWTALLAILCLLGATLMWKRDERHTTGRPGEVR